MVDSPRTPSGLAAAALDWAYGQATSVLPGLGSAEDLAAKYLSKAGNTEDAIDDLIRWQTAFAGATGAIANVGGLLTLPVSLPASMASALFIQLRMVAAIAVLRGYHPEDERVKAASFLCLAGGASGQVVQEAGVAIGSRVSARLLGQVSGTALTRIKQAVGTRIAARLGTTGVANVARFVPLLGSLVGGGIDAVITRGIGAVAKQYFPAVDQPATAGDGPVVEGEILEPGV